MATTTKTSRQRKTGLFTRDRGKLVVVSAATILCVYLCYRLAQPFIPALVWAIMLVGNRLHQHTVITFLAIVGGVALFGGTGIILGPVIVTLTFFLLEVWRTRTAAGRPAECT